MTTEGNFVHDIAQTSHWVRGVGEHTGKTPPGLEVKYGAEGIDGPTAGGVCFIKSLSEDFVHGEDIRGVLKGGPKIFVDVLCGIDTETIHCILLAHYSRQTVLLSIQLYVVTKFDTQLCHVSITYCCEVSKSAKDTRSVANQLFCTCS